MQTVVLKTETVQKIVNYLATQPYAHVAAMLQEVFQATAQQPQLKVEKTEEKPSE
jgi:coenzyme F420-reducing hydrogenase beta subunit